jgi:hypothetical protein
VCGKYECFSDTATMISNKMVIPEVRKIRASGRLHDVFHGDTCMWVLSLPLAECDFSSVQNFEAAHKCFENLLSPGRYSSILE